MVAAAKKLLPTPEEYLALERDAEYKSEYFDGVIVAMADAKPEHSTLTFNLTGEIYPHLKRTNCKGVVSEQRVKATAGNQYHYPDMVVICGEPVYEIIHGLETLTNPTLIIEVLSPSTESLDRGTKWMNYQRISTLRDYLMVWQERPRIEHFSRSDDGNWGYQMLEGLDAVLVIKHFAIEIPFALIYDGVAFDEDEEQS
jgi:Uma2 family endonuclease